MALLAGLLLAAVVVITLIRVLRPPLPPAKLYFIPLRIMGAPLPQDYPNARPTALGNAVVRFETLNDADQVIGPPLEIATDMMGAANVQYTPGFALHIQITSPQFAEREIWLENPRQFAVDSPDYTVTLDRAYAGPRNLPLFLFHPMPANQPASTEPSPIIGAEVSFQLDTIDPKHPEKPVTLTTDDDGKVMLRFPPGRGATVVIQLPGCQMINEHYIDSYDYERRRPSAMIEMKPVETPDGSSPGGTGTSGTSAGGKPASGAPPVPLPVTP